MAIWKPRTTRRWFWWSARRKEHCLTGDHTAIVIPLTETTQQVQLQYFPDLTDENRAGRLSHGYGAGEYEFETVLDWRGYFGPESAVMDGWTMMRRQGHGYIASFTGTFGFVVGHVVRRLVHPQKSLEKDPTALPRLTHLSQKYRDLAMECPDLSREAPFQKDATIVFVHGTVSCGLVGLKDFFRLKVDEPIFRYEHDTFVPLKDNALELTDLVKKVRTDKLLFVAHSRGGLVARMACDAPAMALDRDITVKPPLVFKKEAAVSEPKIEVFEDKVIIGGVALERLKHK